MTVRKIVIEPDPILRRKSDYISNVDNQLRLLMDDMLDTMYKAPGIGLAAVQIGILKRVVVIDISKGKKKIHYAWSTLKLLLSQKNINL